MNALKKNPKLLFVVTEDWYFVSHRLALAQAALKAGFDVSVATRVRLHGAEIEHAGIHLIPIKLRRKSANPYSELMAIAELISIYRRERPDIVHHVAMKPILYGSIAAWLTGVRNVINAIAGMGYIFVSSSSSARVIRWVVKKAFRILFSRENSKVIVQNADDLNFLQENLNIKAANLVLIRGAGVDTRKFIASPEPDGRIIVVLPARMLWDKGVGEFVEAARILREQGSDARFILAGGLDEANPAAIPTEKLSEWNQHADVEWWGHSESMADIYAQSHIICLPSYREGLPKALLEAAASGRPIVTTDVPGCREIVIDGHNGLLVPVKDGQALAKALGRLIADKELRVKMGSHGREMVETEFSEQRVFDQTLVLYRQLATRPAEGHA